MFLFFFFSNPQQIFLKWLKQTIFEESSEKNSVNFANIFIFFFFLILPKEYHTKKDNRLLKASDFSFLVDLKHIFSGRKKKLLEEIKV